MQVFIEPYEKWDLKMCIFSFPETSLSFCCCSLLRGKKEDSRMAISAMKKIEMLWGSEESFIDWLVNN